jgi:integrase
MTLGTWIDIWLKAYKIPFLKPNGLTCVKTCLNHILPVFENCEIENIKGFEIQQFLNTLSHNPNTQHKVKVYFNEILEYAYRNRIIGFNPMLAIKFRVPIQKHRQAMTPKEQVKFKNSLINKPYRLLYLTYLHTGARRAELITPDSFQPNFKNDTVFIDGTKTKGSSRTIPLFKALKCELQAVGNYKAYFEQYKPDHVTKLLRKHCDRINLLHVCVHGLRTTFATNAYTAGVSLKTIQAWLGHSRLEMTDTYLDAGTITNTNNAFALAEIDKMNAFKP